MRTLVLLTVILAMCATPAVAELFVSPIGGTPYEDWTIVNYVDLQPGVGVVDWRGGPYTYNGHNAIDFTLPNFAAMDAGVDVYAARSGTVTAVHDGEYDRWSRVNPNPGHQPNYVVIDHGQGIVTEYLHLKNSSIPVTVGQNVLAGQKIGKVGSSGNSSDAHLHFAVYESGAVVETYLDPDAWWESPLPYAGDVTGTLDVGITDHVPTTTELVDRPIEHNVFYQADGAGQEVYSWANLFGFKIGDQLDYFFYRPNGALYAHFEWETNRIRYGWRVRGIELPAVPDLGEWTVTAQRNGVMLYSDSFLVRTMPGDFDGDSAVDGRDFLAWQRGSSEGPSSASDLAQWQANFGARSGLGANITVPEPGNTTVLALLGLLPALVSRVRVQRHRGDNG